MLLLAAVAPAVATVVPLSLAEGAVILGVCGMAVALGAFCCWVVSRI